MNRGIPTGTTTYSGMSNYNRYNCYIDGHCKLYCTNNSNR